MNSGKATALSKGGDVAEWLRNSEDSAVTLYWSEAGAIKSASQLCRLLMDVAPVICPTSVRSQDP